MFSNRISNALPLSFLVQNNKRKEKKLITGSATTSKKLMSACSNKKSNGNVNLQMPYSCLCTLNWDRRTYFKIKKDIFNLNLMFKDFFYPICCSRATFFWSQLIFSMPTWSVNCHQNCVLWLSPRVVKFSCGQWQNQAHVWTTLFLFAFPASWPFCHSLCRPDLNKLHMSGSEGENRITLLSRGHAFSLGCVMILLIALRYCSDNA